MFTLIAPAVLAGLPAAYELDFAPLTKAGPPYKFVIVLSFKGEPDVRIPWSGRAQRNPTEWADDFMYSLKDPRWKLKRNGDRVIIYGYDDVPIRKVAVEGGDPKPAVRRKFGPPAPPAPRPVAPKK